LLEAGGRLGRELSGGIEADFSTWVSLFSSPLAFYAFNWCFGEVNRGVGAHRRVGHGAAAPLSSRVAFGDRR
jgi:hypothetical protein